MESSGHFITAEITLNARWSIEEGQRAIDDFCTAMRREPGCTLAQAWQDNADPRRFILWERYEDPAAHQRHFTLPHTQAFIDAGWVSLVRVFETTLPARAGGEHNHD